MRARLIRTLKSSRTFSSAKLSAMWSYRKLFSKFKAPVQPEIPVPTAQRRLPPDEENMQRYRLGGFHPVSIGDTFKDGRYEVIRKLGFGIYSTVWLCRDNL